MGTVRGALEDDPNPNIVKDSAWVGVPSGS